MAYDQNPDEYFRSQGLVLNSDGTEWVKPNQAWVDQTPMPLLNPDASPADIAAYRTARAVNRKEKLPVEDDRGHPFGPINPEAPGYLVEPDLQETQGGMHLPPNMYQDAGGGIFFNGSNEQVPIAKRPGLLPVTMTPEGLKFVMPRMADIVGNVMGNVGGKVMAKPGEMVLGSGMVKTTEDALKYPLAKPAERWTNTLGQNDDKLQLMTPDEFLKQGRPLKIDAESRETIDGLKKHIEEGKPLDPLELHPNGKEDGRHRALAAKELGIKEIPVLNFRPSEPFYSALERAVNSAKVDKATLEQWLGYLRNQPGVKAEELGYVLKELPEGPITKGQLEELVKQNKVELKEKVLGKRTDLPKEWFDKPFEEWTPEQLSRLDTKDNPTKYHSYQLPGGENYKEMLLSLPAKPYDAIRGEMATKFREKYGDNFADQWTEAEKTAWLAPTRQEKFNSSHWDEPNVLAHIRMNDRYLKQTGYSVENQVSKNDRMFGSKEEAEAFVNTLPDNLKGKIKIKEVEGGHSKKSLHLEELQSDWGASIRKHGFKGEKERLQNEFDKIEKKILDSNDETIMGQPDIKDALKLAVDKKIINGNEASLYKRYVDIENGNPVPDMPFKKSWTQLAIKRMIHKAASEGYEGISYTPGEAQAARYDLSKHIDKLSYAKNGRLWAWDKNGKQVISKDVKPHELADEIGKEAAEKLMKQPIQHSKGSPGSDYQSLEGADLKIGGEGMLGFYDKIIKDEFNNIGKKYGSKIEERRIGIPHKNGEQGKDLNIPYFPITPELRKHALEHGFPLFSSSPVLSPITYNPFAKSEKTDYKLTPVQGNPFQE